MSQQPVRIPRVRVSATCIRTPVGLKEACAKLSKGLRLRRDEFNVWTKDMEPQRGMVMDHDARVRVRHPNVVVDYGTIEIGGKLIWVSTMPAKLSQPGIRIPKRYISLGLKTTPCDIRPGPRIARRYIRLVTTCASKDATLSNYTKMDKAWRAAVTPKGKGNGKNKGANGVAGCVVAAPGK